MSVYKRVIEEILQEQDSHPHVDTRFLTYYQPTRDRFKKEELKRVKSFILTALKKYKVANNADKLHKKVIDVIMGKLTNLKDLDEGVAVFGKINGDNFKLDRAVTLSRKPRKEIFIGDTYDLEQLIFISNMIDDAAILSLHRDKADAYILTNNKLFKLQTLQNEFALRKERTDLNRVKPSKTDINMHGVGDKSLQQREVKENQEHLREVGDYLSTDVMCAKEFPYLIVYYSEQYNDVIKGWADKYKTKFCSPEIFLINKIFKSEGQITKHALKLITKHKRQMRKHALEIAKESYPNVVTGWDQVYNAAKLGTVDSLFIKSKIEDKYQQIAADVVTNVSRTRGKVIFLSDKDATQPVIAKLRFRV